jgi:hypothetical protein
MKHLIIPIFIAVFLTIPAIGNSQIAQNFDVSIGLSINPDNPRPNQYVTATIESYATDLNAAKTIWKVNGKTIQSGIGIKSAGFNVGDTNTSTELEVDIITAEGEFSKKTMSINPTSLDMIWQASGYTPPFYKGKNLFSYQDLIQFVAVPHITGDDGKEIPAENLIYTWTRNGTVMGDFGGYGRNTYTVLGSIISRQLDIKVQAATTDGTKIAVSETVVRPIDPQVIFYRDDPLYGIIFERALTGIVDLNKTKEVSVVASPYYFGTSDPAGGSLSYTWSLNGGKIYGTGPSMTFRRPEGGVFGVSSISLSISNLTKELQEAAANLSFNFEK